MIKTYVDDVARFARSLDLTFDERLEVIFKDQLAYHVNPVFKECAFYSEPLSFKDVRALKLEVVGFDPCC